MGVRPFRTGSSYLEKTQSQLPALQLLMVMGWEYLPPEETVNLRGGRLGEALLEPVLLEHIRDHYRFEFKGRTRAFPENGVQETVQALKEVRPTGTMTQNESTVASGWPLPMRIKYETA